MFKIQSSMVKEQKGLIILLVTDTDDIGDRR